MAILSFPPEILVHILSFLPIRDLLKFSQTCHYAHVLSSSSLHTLTLDIHSTRISGIMSRLAATQFPQPKAIPSAFSQEITQSPCRSSCSTSSGLSSRRSSTDSTFLDTAMDTDDDPYKVTVLIPEAQHYDYATLLNFHTALTRSILTRHGSTLRNLDVSLWTLTPTIAKTLASLSALRAVSIRIEDVAQTRAVPRRWVASQQADQCCAWDTLARTASWAPRLTALRIEGAELRDQQLVTLLQKSRWCRELWLCKCSAIGKGLWNLLGSEAWEGRAALRILGVMSCGGQLHEDVLDVIGGLNGLQFLSLQGCSGLDSKTVQSTNDEVWRIPELMPPLPPAGAGGPGIDQSEDAIEVDPLYMDAED